MKKFWKITALIFGALVFFLALTLLLLPYFLNLESIKHRLGLELSKKLQARVQLKEVKLKILPQPGLKVRGLSVEKKRYRFRLEEGVLFLGLRALLSRHIQVERFTLIGPELEVFLPSQAETTSKAKEKFYRGGQDLLAKLPPFSMEIERGRLAIFRGKSPLVSFSDLQGSFSFKPSFLQWEIEGRGSMTQRLRFSGRLWPEERLSEGLLAVAHLDLDRLPFLKERFPRAILRSDLNLEVSYRFEEGALLLGFTATAPCLLKGKEETYLFNCSALLGQARFKPPYFHIELKEWVMKEPSLRARGVITHNEKGYLVSLDFLEGRWEGVRQRLLAFWGQKKGLKRLCQIVEAGQVKDFHLETRAPEVRRLFHLKTLLLKGQVIKARLNLPTPRVVLHQVSGQLNFQKGSLRVKDASARFQETTLSQASFAINLHQLKDRSSPLLLRGQITGRAEDVLLVLSRTPLPVSLAERLSHTKAKGPLQGWLLLEGTIRKPRVSFEIRPQGVSLNYEGLPLPFRLEGGKIRCQGRLLTLTGLKIRFPESVLRNLNAQLDFRQHPPRLALTEARGLLSVAETLRFLSFYRQIASHLKKYGFEGKTVVLTDASYDGPLSPKGVLERLRFRLKGENLKISLPWLPAPLLVVRGAVFYENFSLLVEPSEVRLLDAQGLVTGKIGFRPFALRFEAEASSRESFLQWAYKLGRIPEELFPRTPLTARSLTFIYEPSNLFLEGDFLCQEAAFHLRLSHRKGLFTFKTQLQKPTFTLSLQKTPTKIDFELNGEIDDQGIRRYLSTNPFLIQKVKGRFRGSYFPENILKSTFEGELRLSRFRIPSKKYPFWIEDLDLKAQKKILFVRRLEMDLNGTSFEAHGRLEISPNLLNIDAAAYIPTLVVEDFLSALQSQKRGQTSKKSSKKPKLVVHLLLSADSVLYQNYEWSPFEGEIFYHPRDFKLVVRETYLCGIKLWGSYERTQREDLRLSFDQPEGQLKETLQCLFGSDLIEGPYQLKGYLHTQGKRLFEKTSGRYLFLSQKGHIYKFGTLAKIFALLSPLDIFQGNLPDFEKKGTDYNFWEVKGKFEKHFLIIDSWHLEAPGFRTFASGKIDLLKQKIDVTVLVSPFKAIDSLVGHVPLIGWILTGKSKVFLAVPVKVRGHLKDPSVIPLDPTAVGAGVFGIIKRTFQLPVKIFVPDKEKPLTLPPPEGK